MEGSEVKTEVQVSEVVQPEPTNKEKANKKLKPPITSIFRMNVGHLGKILAHISIPLFLVCIFMFMSGLFTIIYYLFLITLVVLTCFMILIPPYNETFFKMWQAGEHLDEITPILMNVLQYMMPVCIGCAALSILLMCFNKPKVPIARIVISSIILVISVLVYVFMMIGVTA